MSSHSETTEPRTVEPLSDDDLRSYLDVPPQMDSPWAQHLVDRLIATIRSLQARIRDLTVQIVNDEERSSFTAVLLARDERIRALSDMLQEVRDTHELWSPRWNYGHSPMRMQRDEEMEQRIDVLLKKADDG